MPKNIIGAWRGFSTLCQVDITTAKAVDTLVPFTGELSEPEPDMLYTNKDEITGAVAPTVHQLISTKLMTKHKSKGFPHLVALFASMAMGKDTPAVVGTTTAYKHKIEIDPTVIELPKRTMVENDGFAQFKYKGVACVGFQMSCARDGFLEFEADLIGSGYEASGDGTSKPSRVNESYLVYGDTKLTRGGTFDGTTVTGGTDLSAQLVDFQFAFKNNGKGVHLMGDSSGYFGSIRRGKEYGFDLKAKFEVEDQTHRAALLAGTEYVLEIPLVGGVANDTAHYAVHLIFPRVIYKAAKKGADDGTLVVGGEFEVMSDPTYGAFLLTVTNLMATGYLATA